MARRRNAKEHSQKLDLDEVAKLFDLPTREEIYEDISQATADYFHDALTELRRQRERDLEEGEELTPADEGELEDEARKVEEREADEMFSKYLRAVEATAEKFFELHELVLDQGHELQEYTVEPADSWEKAANAIRETINGMGYFEFQDLEEFLESGPYTAKEAVLSHLHWMKDYADVYGEPKPARVFERHMR